MLYPNIFKGTVMDDLMNELMGYPCNLEKEKEVPETIGRMAADVKEYDDHYELDLELPGFKKEEVKVELEDGYLKISAEHSEKKEEKDDGGKYIRKERHYGKLKRNFYVGYNIKKDSIKATFENGVLSLNVKKENETESKELIEIF